MIGEIIMEMIDLPPKGKIRNRSNIVLYLVANDSYSIALSSGRMLIRIFDPSRGTIGTMLNTASMTLI